MVDDSLNEAAGPSAAFELIVAVAENDVIGRGNTLPWHLARDLKHFKAITLGRNILMGRKTYESIGKALPGRVSFVLTRSRAFNPGDCRVVRSVAQARLEGAQLVIGGAEVYRLCLPEAARIHLTLVHTVIPDGDTFFPEWRGPEWIETSRVRHEADERNAFACSFIELQRRHGGQHQLP